MPIVCDNIKINAGIVIDSPIYIGNYVPIGANAVVVHDIQTAVLQWELSQR